MAKDKKNDSKAIQLYKSLGPKALYSCPLCPLHLQSSVKRSLESWREHVKTKHKMKLKKRTQGAEERRNSIRDAVRRHNSGPGGHVNTCTVQGCHNVVVSTRDKAKTGKELRCSKHKFKGPEYASKFGIYRCPKGKRSVRLRRSNHIKDRTGNKMERGLFVVKNFTEGDFITEYTGKKLRRNQCGDGRMTLKHGEDLYQGEHEPKEGFGLGQFANGSSSSKGHKANAKFVWLQVKGKGKWRAWLRAECNIVASEERPVEVLICYNDKRISRYKDGEPDTYDHEYDFEYWDEERRRQEQE